MGLINRPFSLGSIFAVYIGSSELLGIFIVMAPISLITDILFLAFHEGHKGAPVHGFGIFINVVCMITKIIATALAYQLKKEVCVTHCSLTPQTLY